MTFYDKLHDLKHDLPLIFKDAYDLKLLDESGHISHSASLDTPGLFNNVDLQAAVLAILLPQNLNNLSSAEFIELIKKTVKATWNTNTEPLVQKVFEARTALENKDDLQCPAKEV